MRKYALCIIGGAILFGILSEAVLAEDFCLGKGPVTAYLIVLTGQQAPTATMSDPEELKSLEAYLK